MPTSKKEIKKGFTLVEMLLYIVIISTTLTGVFVFLNALIRTRVKMQTAIEVEQQGIFIAETLSQDIRNAISAENPSPNALSLAEADGTTIAISLEDGKLMRSVSAGTSALHSARLSMSDLSISNQATAGPPSIQISFILSNVNPSHRPEYDYARTFTASATLRNK